jgi:tetratricopeptide (TPR) repeat protein
MSYVIRVIALCASLAALPGPAGAAESACVTPAFGVDRVAVIAACTAELQTTLSDKERLRLLITRGRAAHRDGQLQDAIRDFDAALALAPGEVEPYLRRAWTAYDQKDYARVISLAGSALELDQNNAEPYDLMGVVAADARNFAAAKAAYDKAVALAPGSVMPRFHRFELYKQIGAHREAIEELNALLALDTPELDTRFDQVRHRKMSYRTLSRLERAKMFVSMGREDDAIKAFDAWVNVEPGPVSYTWRGWFYLDRNRFDLARADLEKASSYDANFWLPYNLQGWVACYRRDYAAAVPLFTAAIERRHNAGTSYWGRSIALRELKRTDEATKDALTAVSVDSNFLDRKIKTLTQLGYLQLPKDGGDRMPAVRDAVTACMLDERCW